MNKSDSSQTKEVLFVSRLGKFFSDFEISDISIWLDAGYEVWCAANFDAEPRKLDAYPVHRLQLDLERSPLSRKNLTEYKKLVALIREHDFALMHCHMPIGGVFARLAAKKTNFHPVVYTAHGLQFCKGGPKKDWILYYPVEKFLSRYTDTLIVLNQEDYDLASRKFHAKRVKLLRSVGIDLKKFAVVQPKRQEICRELSIPEDTFLALSVGELSDRKNQHVLIEGLARLANPKIHLLLCGIGVKEQELRDLAKEKGLEAQVHFLGYRNDIYEIDRSVDCFLFPSKREGLPVALLEAMTAGLPIVCSAARGNTELVTEGENGFLCPNNSPEEYAQKLGRLYDLYYGSDEDRETLKKMGEISLQRVQEHDLPLIRKEMEELYQQTLEG